MPFVPSSVLTEEVMIHQTDLGRAETPIQSLSWPGHKRFIWRLSLAQKQAWYASRDPQELIELGKDFQRWWFWHYLLPLRAKRMVYKLNLWRTFMRQIESNREKNGR